MAKPKAYLNKSDSELLRYLQRLGQDETWCKDKADEFGNSAAGEHYLRAAADARKEIARVKEELNHRAALQ